MNRVCHLTTVHQPFDIRIFQKECQSLTKNGYQVSLVAVNEKDELRDGVQILALKRPSNRFERWRMTRKQCLERALEADARVYHFHDPELIPVGLKLKSLGKTVVYDVHESHGESILDRAYLHPILRGPMSRHIDRLEAKADALLDAIVAATPKIARQFSNERTVLVQNYPMKGELSSNSATAFEDRERAVAYLGGVSAIRGAREMVEALALAPGVKLIVIGEYSPTSLKTELESLPGWKQVENLGWQDRKGVASALGRCVGGVVLFHPLRNHVEAQPNKLFEYMSAGLPVIASDFPYWREIVETDCCGLLADPLNVNEIAAALRQIASDDKASSERGRRGRIAVEEKYNWGVEESKLLNLYQALMS